MTTMQEDPQTRIAKLVADLWLRSRQQVSDRVAVLEAAANAARNASLGEPQQSEAEAIAHKLAGSLGMFGFQGGTEIARDLELELREATPDPVRLTQLCDSLRALLFPQD
jgi:HPt (histidine-containing phosphotransfer) domain-containing protein